MAITSCHCSSALTTNSNRRSTITEIDCAIIGGGPAGLITSIALSHSSPSSSIAIFEKDNFEPKGASVQISSKGWKSIEKIDEDLVKKLKCRGVPVTDLEVKPWRFDSNAKKEEDVSNWKRVQNKIKKQLKKGQKKLIGLLLNTVKRQVHRWHDVRMTLKDHAEELYIGNSEKLQAQKEVNMPLINRNCILTDCKVLEDAKENEAHKFELTFQNVVADTKDEAGSSESSFTVRSKFLFACDGTKSVVRSILPKEPDVLLSEDKSVWRGVAPNIDAKGKATFYRGVATDDTAGRSALIFPGGRNAGSSWTVISDVVDGKSESLDEAKERVLRVLKTMNDNHKESGTSTSTLINPEYEMWMGILKDTIAVIENKLQIRDFDQPWESAYDGLVYVGDSLHPVRPTGEGLALTFEDAQVLGQVIAKLSGDDAGIVSDAALREYEHERYLPVKEISEEIRAAAEGFYKKPRDS